MSNKTNKELFEAQMKGKINDLKSEYEQKKENADISECNIYKKVFEWQKSVAENIIKYPFTEKELNAIVNYKKFFQFCWEESVMRSISHASFDDIMKRAAKRAINHQRYVKRKQKMLTQEKCI